MELLIHYSKGNLNNICSYMGNEWFFFLISIHRNRDPYIKAVSEAADAIVTRFM